MSVFLLRPLDQNEILDVVWCFNGHVMVEGQRWISFAKQWRLWGNYIICKTGSVKKHSTEQLKLKLSVTKQVYKQRKYTFTKVEIIETEFVVYRHQACWEQSPHLQMVFFLGLLARYFWSLTYTWGYISYGFVLALGKLSLNVLVQYSLSFYCEIHPILLALIEVISSLMYTNSSICKFKREIWS